MSSLSSSQALLTVAFWTQLLFSTLRTSHLSGGHFGRVRRIMAGLQQAGAARSEFNSAKPPFRCGMNPNILNRFIRPSQFYVFISIDPFEEPRSVFSLVGDTGLEPATPCVSCKCSNQLS